ncbi:MAG: hypothetical protein AB8B93_05265 [Pseudomonadales bacterium]
MSIQYRPRTGVGRFKAKLKGDELEIKHHMYIVGDVLNTPTVAELDKFQRQFQTLIPEHWEDKYQFRRGDRVVKPRFVQKFVPEGEKLRAHFVINLKSNDGPSAVVARDPYFKFAKGVTGDALNDVSRSANLYVGSTSVPNTAKAQADSLKTILPMYVDFSGTQLSTHTRQQINNLGKRLAALNPKPQLHITGYGTHSNANQDTIAQLLRSAGLPGVKNRSSKKALLPRNWGRASTSKMSGGTEYVKISASAEVNTSSMLANSALYSYPATVVHEFGHMLGLQDEYSCMGAKASAAMVAINIIHASEQAKYENLTEGGGKVTSPRIDDGQAAFIRLCGEANVAAPHFGLQTDSIMSSGNQFKAAHFVFPWDALCQITGQNDWVIEEV